MKKILFLCHGNICRSPMAERVMKDLVKKKGLDKEFEITSGAVSDEEWGNPIYPPAKRKLAEHAISSSGHSAHKISRAEFDENDLVIVMDCLNLTWLARIVGDEKVADHDKVHMLMEFAEDTIVPREKATDVADPWYTGDFETTYREVVAGCNGILNFLHP